MGKELEIDPWGQTVVDDYQRLCDQFGVELIDKYVKKFSPPHNYLNRGIIFGHRDINKILLAIKKKETWAVLSGIKPSGEFHLGSMTTAKEIVYFQKLGGQAFYTIADIEAYEDNGIHWEDSVDTAVSNVADILALGLDGKKAFIYRQSKEKRVIDTAFKVSRAVTLKMIEAIYGSRNIGLYMASMIQVGDILLPQHDDFGGLKPTVIPVGVDQDPHIRLTRDIARKFGFQLPSSVLHKLALGLQGNQKMGKRSPDSYFVFTEPMKDVKRKVMQAFTGGRTTAEEQRKLGGRPNICPIYDMCRYHIMEDDDELQKLYHDCTTGVILCGECKMKRFETLKQTIENHNKSKLKFIDKARVLLKVD
jgi:tryptophanyl-tRNA synthetase